MEQTHTLSIESDVNKEINSDRRAVKALLTNGHERHGKKEEWE